MAGLVAVELAAVEMSFMKSDAGARPRSAPRSYGKLALKVQRLALAFAVAGLVFNGPVGTASAAERTIKVVALGDSLTAGFQLHGNAAFPVQLERALKAKGIAVEVANAGVSGDTSSGGLARLDWSVPDGTDAVILELGANDMLRGVDTKVTRNALSEIVKRLKARHIEVLLCGMRAAPNLGADYGRAFDAIYPELAAANDLLLYPFFLEGVVADPKLNIGDGLHPTGEGVAKIVSGILPKVEALLARVRAKSGT
jgi:acyl-CoA thioesterase-1